MQPLVGAETEHQLAHGRIGGKTLSAGHGLDEIGRRHDFEALVDAGKKFRRDDQALNLAELHAFGLPLRSSPIGSPDKSRL